MTYKSVDILKIAGVLLFTCMLSMLVSCGERDIEPALNAAPGGGTLTDYVAYNLDSITGQSAIYGKIVFWDSKQDYTLVQVSLYNTSGGIAYPAAIYSDAIGSGAIIQQLYAVDGSAGEFSPQKFYVINDAGFFANLPQYDAHVSVMDQAGKLVVAAGNIGLNAAE